MCIPLTVIDGSLWVVSPFDHKIVYIVSCLFMAAVGSKNACIPPSKIIVVVCLIKHNHSLICN